MRPSSYPPGIALHPRLPSAENELRKTSGMVERGHASNSSFRIAPEGVAVGEVCCTRREGLVTCPRSRALCTLGTIKRLQPTNEVMRPGNATIPPTVSMESQLLVKILNATIRRISVGYRPVNYGNYDVCR